MSGLSATSEVQRQEQPHREKPDDRCERQEHGSAGDLGVGAPRDVAPTDNQQTDKDDGDDERDELHGEILGPLTHATAAISKPTK